MLPPSSGGGASSRIFYIREELHRISRVHISTSVYFHAYIHTYLPNPQPCAFSGYAGGLQQAGVGG